MKETRQGHFAVLLTGAIEGNYFPSLQFPRLKTDDPELAMLFSLRRSNPPRWNMFGGRRKTQNLTGLACLHDELREEAGPHVHYEVLGAVGTPLYFDAPTHHDYAYPWLCLHTGGEPFADTAETTSYDRVTLANVSRFACVKGSNPEKLGRTELMIQFGISLCQIPVFHAADLEAMADEIVPLTGGVKLANVISKYPAAENVIVAEDHLLMRTPTTLTVWPLVGKAELLAARDL